MFNHINLREMQIKTSQRFQLTAVRKTVLAKQITTNAGEDVGKSSLIHYWWGCKLVQ